MQGQSSPHLQYTYNKIYCTQSVTNQMTCMDNSGRCFLNLNTVAVFSIIGYILLILFLIYAYYYLELTRENVSFGMTFFFFLDAKNF